MTLVRYESHGRKLMVEFKCYRCKKTEIRSLEECMEEVAEYFQGLYDLKPPKEWKDGGFYYPMFCPKCAKENEMFLKGGE